MGCWINLIHTAVSLQQGLHRASLTEWHWNKQTAELWVVASCNWKDQMTGCVCIMPGHRTHTGVKSRDISTHVIYTLLSFHVMHIRIFHVVIYISIHPSIHSEKKKRKKTIHISTKLCARGRLVSHRLYCSHIKWRENETIKLMQEQANDLKMQVIGQ